MTCRANELTRNNHLKRIAFITITRKDDRMDDMSAFLGIGVFIILVIILIPFILFLLTLQRALERCSPECRTTSPGTVWLMLIPLFNIVWEFLLVMRIAESLENEFKKRNMPHEPKPGQSIGLAMCILSVCGIIPILGILAGIAGFVCWILYWVKIYGFSNDLSVVHTVPGTPIG